MIRMFNKIGNRFNINLLATIIFSTTWLPILYAQNNSELQVIKDFTLYKQSLKNDSLKRMVELKTIVPNIQYDLRYATVNNFMHQQVYKNGSNTFLRLGVARALARVQQELNEKNLSLKIWDAYRPYSVTQKMWDLIKDERYVADPKKGSGHNRGIAVDLTIIDRKTGKELDMGTGFDNFTDTAHQDFKNLPDEILNNRSLLKTAMEKYGFVAMQTEWWHFYWHDPGFEVLDIDPKKFKKNIN
jgi:D-alanyl-D-alanine dipeptidase